MSELKEKVKEQLDQVNDSLEQFTKAGRGLVVKLSQESSKQFDGLVKAGEAQEEEGKGLVEQVRESFEGQFSDVKGSVHQLRLAALGLFTKARQNSGKYFNELVELGAGDTAVASTKSAKPAAKKTEAAA